MKRMKRLLTALLAAAMLTATLPMALAAGGIFRDVPENAWYAEAVSYVQDKGIMTGTSDATFTPQGTMTRAMLVTVLYRVAGTPAVSSGMSFSDVAANAYYANAVTWASSNGIVNGYSSERFAPNDAVSRAQIATILWRYAGSPTATAGQDFADESSIPAYAASAVDWARANGVVSGKDGNRFDPQAGATRAEVAAIFHHYLTKDQNDPQPDPGKTGKVLVAYFSGSGNTERVAKTIADALNADLFAITPVTPYTSDDLNWTVEGSRVNREHDNEALRDVALTQTTPANWNEYDTVFLGYPIWWGIAAWPVNTFVKNNDFTGKTVIPFATSASSGMGQSRDLLQQMANSGTWESGQRFSGGASDSTVRSWADGLNIAQ